MRVAFLTDDLESGGAARQLSLLATALPSDWECRVWTLGRGPYLEALRASGVEVVVRERRARFDVATPTASLLSSLRTWRPDVVHSWGWMSSSAGGVACRMLHIPLLDGSIRTGSADRGSLLRAWLGFRLARRVVANSYAGLAAFRVSAAKGRVVHNAFDSTRLVSCCPEPERPEAPFTVIMTGRMEAPKDFRTFIAAAEQLSRADASDWLFLAVGQGADHERLACEASPVGAERHSPLRRRGS